MYIYILIQIVSKTNEMPGVAPEQLLKNADFKTSRPTERAVFLVLSYKY